LSRFDFKSNNILTINKEHKMPAKVNQDDCTGCEACVGCCPTEAIVMEAEKAKVTDECIDCGACVDECPVEAISMQ
jgi:NAD-dependent dihydropyrimidine dehydrogenase PreA subunit